MAEIILIREEDIHGLKFTKLDLDVEVNGTPYQVIHVPGFAHCIGGHLDNGDGNCYWAYPLNEEMTIDNLIEFDGEPGAAWGLEYTPTNYYKFKWDEGEIRRGRKLIITRNGEPFYDGLMTFHQAIAYVKDGLLDEHPLGLNERDFDKKCIGRKVWWRSEPAVITRYIKGQACVILKPDGIDHFTVPAEFADEEPDYYCDTVVKTNIFDDNIWWFRED